MHRKVFLFTGIVLLVLACLFTPARAEDDTTEGSSTTETTHTTEATTETTHSTHSTHTTEETTSTTHEHTGTTHEHTGTTKKNTGTSKATKKTTKKRKNNYGGSYGYGSNYNKGKYNNNNNYEVVGEDGIDPSKDGQDYGDFGPIKDKKRQSMLSSLNVWISSASKGPNYDDDDSDDNDDPKGYRNKRSYKKINFPVKRVKNIRQFPLQRFPPLISIFPWVPIFYDKLTYQTIIFSPTGGLYIIPPLINFYGQRFAVAQLIKWGYASLVSSGAPVGPGVDVAPLVGPPPPPAAVPAGGGPPPAAGPTYDAAKARFTGGVKTDFRDFKPRYSQTIEEGGEPGPSNYGTDKNYGGSRSQQVYAQGGSKSYGGY